jgi:pyridoxal phosphate enzyme (YggS family)
MSIGSNYEEIFNKVKNLKKENTPTIISVSKTKPLSMIEEAYSFGIRVFGENKIQEAITKFTELQTNRPEFILHHIGPVQSGTLKKLFGLFSFTHGVGSMNSLEELSKQSLKSKKTLHFFLQANLTLEDTKHGFTESELELLVPKISNYETEYLKFHGLMTMGPSNGDAIKTKNVFNKLKSIRNTFSPTAKLSMGMSDDYTIALEEDTNFLRIGSAIFGDR